MDQEKVETGAYTLYPTQQFTVTQVAKAMFDGNKSAAVRYIISDWARQNWTGEDIEPTPIEKAIAK